MSKYINGQKIVEGIFEAGSAAQPAIYFVGENGTKSGIYYTTQSVNITISGALRSQLDATGVRTANVYAMGSTDLIIRGTSANSSIANGVKITNSATLSTEGSRIASFYPDNGVTLASAISSDGSYYQRRNYTTTANGATHTTNYTVEDGKVCMVTARIVVRESDNTGFRTLILVGTFYRNGGGAVQEGTTTTLYDQGTAVVTVSLSASGNYAQVAVLNSTGGNAEIKTYIVFDKI